MALKTIHDRPNDYYDAEFIMDKEAWFGRKPNETFWRKYSDKQDAINDKCEEYLLYSYYHNSVLIYGSCPCVS